MFDVGSRQKMTEMDINGLQQYAIGGHKLPRWPVSLAEFLVYIFLYYEAIRASFW